MDDGARVVHNGNKKGEKREEGTEEIFEAVMTENFPKLMSDTKGDKYQKSKNKQKHVGILYSSCKKSKIKKKSWKKPEGKKADLSSETMSARTECSDIFKVLREKNDHHRILYPMKLSLKSEGKITTFSDKQKLRKPTASRYALQEIINHLERKNDVGQKLRSTLKKNK